MATSKFVVVVKSAGVGCDPDNGGKRRCCGSDLDVNKAVVANQITTIYI